MELGGPKVEVKRQNFRVTVFRVDAATINLASQNDSTFLVPASFAGDLNETRFPDGAIITQVEFTTNLFAWGEGGNSIRSAVKDFSVKDHTRKRIFLSLTQPIIIVFTEFGEGSRRRDTTTSNANESTRTCQRWDSTKKRDTDECKGANVPQSCFGAWSTGNVTTRSSTGDGVQCAIPTLGSTSSDGVGVSFSFRILPPRISASNFDVRNSWVIYLTFASFASVTLLLYLFNRYELMQYQKFQSAAQEGTLMPVSVFRAINNTLIEAKPGNVWQRTWAHFKDGLATRHPWFSTIARPYWRHPMLIQPRRIVRLWTLTATVSVVGLIDCQLHMQPLINFFFL
jgi:hypothetical protein